MEPRPQRPRPQPRASAQPTPPQPTGQRAQAQVTHSNPQVVVDETGAYGAYDQGAYAAPSRTSYDYSPLDLVPPSQRRRRQLIAGGIGALSILLLGALAVFGYMLLQDGKKPDDDPNNTNNRVAEATESPVATTGPSASDLAQTPTVVAEQTATVAPTTEAQPTATTAAAVTDVASLQALLPDTSTVPEGFAQGEDAQLDQATVADYVGGGRMAEQNLVKWGWSGNVSRTFSNPAAGQPGVVDYLNVSMHGFKDATSAQEALTSFSDYLMNSGGYTEGTAPALGDAARLLTVTDEAGATTVQLYVAKDGVLYKFSGASTGGDPTQAVIDFATETLN